MPSMGEHSVSARIGKKKKKKKKKKKSQGLNVDQGITCGS